MLNQYPMWKNVLIAVVMFFGALYALPNIYSQDPVIEVTGTRNATVSDALQAQLEAALKSNGITPKRVELSSDKLQLRFEKPEDQLKAQDVVARSLSADFTHAMTLSPDVPTWLSGVGGKPMNLGLDLRGGIHVLIDVDMDAAIEKAMEVQVANLREFMRNEKIRYVTVKSIGTAVEVRFRSVEDRSAAQVKVANEFRTLVFTDRGGLQCFLLSAGVGCRVT